MTECNQSGFGFEGCGSREIVARFDGGTISSDGGAFLLRQTDQRMNLLPRLAVGYEDLNDHEQLRKDPVFAVLAGREPMEEPLAGKSTLNRMELGTGIND